MGSPHWKLRCRNWAEEWSLFFCSPCCDARSRSPNLRQTELPAETTAADRRQRFVFVSRRGLNPLIWIAKESIEVAKHASTSCRTGSSWPSVSIVRCITCITTSTCSLQTPSSAEGLLCTDKALPSSSSSKHLPAPRSSGHQNLDWWLSKFEIHLCSRRASC